MASKSTISKSWAFTKNNYVDADIQFFTDWPDYSYCIFGRETAPSTGTPHLQGYFTLKKAVRPSALKKVLPQGTHFEVARKPHLANFRYCAKSGDYTEIDRRHGRPGDPLPLTDSSSPPPPPASSDDPTVSRIFETCLPKFTFKSFRQ